MAFNRNRTERTTKQQNTGGAGAAAQVTIAAPGADFQTILKLITWSYSAAPTGGNLNITSGGTTIVDFDISAAGPGALVADIPANNANEAMVITLAGPGGAVIGKLSVHSFKDFFVSDRVTS